MNRYARRNMAIEIDGIRFDTREDFEYYVKNLRPLLQGKPAVRRVAAPVEPIEEEEEEVEEEVEEIRSVRQPQRTPAPAAKQAASASPKVKVQEVDEEIELAVEKPKKVYKHEPKPWNPPAKTQLYQVQAIMAALGGTENLIDAALRAKLQAEIQKYNKKFASAGARAQRDADSNVEIMDEYLSRCGLPDDGRRPLMVYCIYKALETYELLPIQTFRPNREDYFFGGMMPQRVGASYKPGKPPAPQLFKGRIELSAAICKLYGLNVQPYNSLRGMLPGTGNPVPNLSLDNGVPMTRKEFPAGSGNLVVEAVTVDPRCGTKPNPRNLGRQNNSMWLRGY